MTTINIQAYCKEKQQQPIEWMLWTFAISLILFSFCLDSPLGIVKGIWKLVLHPDGLITDYVAVGGFGATFMNSGILMCSAISMFKRTKTTFSGPAIACTFLMAGFSMFGKNVVNIWPIVLGVFLYSKVQRQQFSKYIYIALYGTALSPLITAVALGVNSFILKFVFSLLAGLVIGFALPPLSSYCLRVHQGYNLYNVGFSAGLVGTALVSVMKSFGFPTESSLVWSYENNQFVIAYLYLIFLSFMLIGFVKTPNKKDILRLYRHSGRLMADFIILDSFPIVLFNMGSLGVFATSYILIIGGNINGATIGGIFTIVGFGAFGKHLRNVIPIVMGVVLGSVAKVWNIQDPNVQMAALFGTALAPISGQFGWFWGVVAGFLHSSMVLNIGVFHGGLNLYNNGFSAGLVALILVPIIETLPWRRSADLDHTGKDVLINEQNKEKNNHNRG